MREFLQQASYYNPRKHNVAGHFISEMLDGTRCFWDGGISRGVPTVAVPWAKVTNPKTGRLQAQVIPFATGLWTRNGHPISAPDWFLNQLPCCPLDGMLLGDSTRPDEPNKTVFAVYSSPPLEAVFQSGWVKSEDMLWYIDYPTISVWIDQRLRLRDDFQTLKKTDTFADELAFLNTALENSELSICYLHPQKKLIDIPEAAADQVEYYLQKALSRGKGVVIRNPASSWIPRRHGGILKYTLEQLTRHG